MPDTDTPADAAQAAAAATPQAGDPDDAQAAESTQEPETISLEEARKLRRQIASYRTRAQELETQARAREEADLSESEKLRKQAEDATKRAEDLETQLRQERGRAAVARVAAKVGLILDLAEPHLKPDFDEDGQVDERGLERAASDLLKKYPQLGLHTSTSSATNGARGPGMGETDVDRRRRLLT